MPYNIHLFLRIAVRSLINTGNMHAQLERKRQVFIILSYSVCHSRVYFDHVCRFQKISHRLRIIGLRVRASPGAHKYRRKTMFLFTSSIYGGIKNQFFLSGATGCNWPMSTAIGVTISSIMLAALLCMSNVE